MNAAWTIVLLVLLVVMVGWHVARLVTRRQHPWRIFLRTANIAFYLGAAAFIGLLPPEAAWAWWPTILLVTATTVYACARALAAPTDENSVVTGDSRAPKRSEIAVSGVLALAAAAAALLGP